MRDFPGKNELVTAVLYFIWIAKLIILIIRQKNDNFIEHYVSTYVNTKMFVCLFVRVFSDHFESEYPAMNNISIIPHNGIHIFKNMLNDIVLQICQFPVIHQGKMKLFP